MRTALILCVILYSSHTLSAQEQKNENLGLASDFIKEIKKASTPTKTRKSRKTFKLDKEGKVTSDISLFSDTGNAEIFCGKVTGEKNSNVRIEIKNNKVSGTILMLDSKKAFRYSTNTANEVSINEIDINKVACVDFSKDTKNSKSNSSKKLRMPPVQVNLLHSNYGAPATIYLDFDGEYVLSDFWNGGQPINALPSNFDPSEIHAIWSIVAEDFAPFNIDVTTDRAYYDSKPYGSKHMNIFTPTDIAHPNVGGVAIIGTFIVEGFCPSWSYNIGIKPAGVTASHEIGHALGLLHDGNTNYEYESGYNNWGPIMGAPFDMDITQWSKGEYINANNPQDDLSTIASPNNKFGYRIDDCGKTLGAATPLQYFSINNDTGIVGHSGIIEKNTDIDLYRFQTTGGFINLTVHAAEPRGGASVANLDIKAQLLDNNGNVIRTFDYAGMHADVYHTATSGTYYLRIEGTGSGDPLTGGFSKYGSIGQYYIDGTIPRAVTGQFVAVVAYPEDGTDLLNPGTIRVTPRLFSPSTITKVEYFEGSTKLGQSLTNQPSHYFDVSNFSSGTHTIYVKATNANNQVVTSDPITFTVYRSLAPDNSNSTKSWGLVYNYYEGTYATLPDFSGLTPVYKGIAEGLNLTSIPVRSDNFALRFTGFIQIHQESLYKLSLNSDDGSKLYIGNNLIINNDGNHPMTEVSEKVALSAGYYPITIEYFEAQGGQDIILSLLDDLTKTKLYPTFYYSGVNLTPDVYPKNKLLSGVSYEYYQGSYSLVPDFNNLTPVSSGALTKFDLTIPNRAANYYAARFTSFLEIQYAGLYNFFTKSDDGSKLYIDDILVVSNDGSHGMIEKTGSIWLNTGKHKIRVEYFQRSSGQGLVVSYSGPGIYKKEISSSVLSRNPVLGEQVPYVVYGLNIPGVISAEHYDQGGEGYAYHDNTAGNQFNLYRTDGVDVKEHNSFRYPDYWIGDIQDGEWVEYTVNVTQTGPVNFNVYCTSGNGNSKFHLEVNNVPITPIVNVPVLTDVDATQVIAINNIQMTQGEKILKVFFDKGGFLFDQIYSQDATTARHDLTFSADNSHNQILTFPNPFDDYLNIDLSSLETPEQLRILNLNGVAVWQSSKEDLKDQLYTFTEQLEPGLYILEIKTKNEIKHSTIVKK